MKTLLGWMVTSIIFVVVGSYIWMHVRRSADAVDIQPAPIVEHARQAAHAASPGDSDAQPGVTMVGPLADYMAHQGPGANKVETIQAAPYRPVESDHVGGSVVGTSKGVVQQAFAVAGTVDLPFEIPAHAYSPQLRGTFRSFTQAGSKPTATPGDVEFLLLNEQEFLAFLDGHPSEAVFSADASHYQEVNANLPPTLNQPTKYHLIFRNASPKDGKKVVKAEFQIDF